MINEKSLRIGTAADNQFTNFVEPQDAAIEINVSSDIRQVGKLRLMSKIADFLQSEGYTNVTTTVKNGKQISKELFINDDINNRPWLDVQIKINEQ